MIQRIQTIYLIIALALTSALFFIDMADIAGPGEFYNLNFKGVADTADENMLITTIPALTILLSVTTFLLFISIFLYKKRMIQIRVCALNMALLPGTSLMIFYTGRSFASELGAEIAYNITLVLPLIAAIFVFLAIRAIGKDEALVRSLDRIR
ncbi:DUF4293 domain-containing protein [Marinilabiliaceae bacterium ANBcel2]|nr:DUF4293 domain-containing protein [Marinilabiliaceae bacterium ANBcel2]